MTNRSALHVKYRVKRVTTYRENGYVIFFETRAEVTPLKVVTQATQIERVAAQFKVSHK